eukprot:TRINITY_DN10868_c0_g1_i1.p1 TRINITY_DN10868_c0_g1~~TRINITY_DN10868_c0_g1_i1.p1  ORF type:complete len:189 (+),score=4.86 TRINITY_DN10868_c0_g1_i1:249-815(+)
MLWHRYNPDKDVIGALLELYYDQMSPEYVKRIVPHNELVTTNIPLLKHVARCGFIVKGEDYVVPRPYVERAGFFFKKHRCLNISSSIIVLVYLFIISLAQYFKFEVSGDIEKFIAHFSFAGTCLVISFSSEKQRLVLGLGNSELYESCYVPGFTIYEKKGGYELEYSTIESFELTSTSRKKTPRLGWR